MAVIDHIHLERLAPYCLPTAEMASDAVDEAILKYGCRYFKGGVFGSFIECPTLRHRELLYRKYQMPFLVEVRPQALAQHFYDVEAPFARVGPAEYTVYLKTEFADLHGIKTMLRANTQHDIMLLVRHNLYRANFAHEDDYIWAMMSFS